MSFTRDAAARAARSASAAWLLLAGCSALSSASDQREAPVSSPPKPAVTAPATTGGASGTTGGGAVGASGPVTGGAASQPSAPTPLDTATPATSDAGPLSNAPDAMAAPFQGALVFTVTTKQAADSRFAPRNVVAIWIEDAGGAPVKVLAELAGIMRRSLTLYGERVMPPAFFSGSTERDPDTITMATQRDYGTHTVTWDLTDTQGQPVPDGVYTIFVECADGRVPPAVASVVFEKGPDAIAIEVAETDQFGPISLQYTPPDP